ncbi:MAG: ABC transporter permease [Rhodospirillales bacterium]
MSGMAAAAPAGRQWRQACRLAFRDFLHEWRVSLCLIFALAAVLAPLLVLFGLKSGIIATMTERLRADPRNLEISLRGHQRLDPAWFAAVRTRPEAGFVLPRTRLLAATISLESDAGFGLPDIDMLPTAAGDPLLPAGTVPAAGLRQILLTATAAGRLKVNAGEQVTGRVFRRLGDRPQTLVLPLTVAGVIPETAFGRDAAFVSLDLLTATENYRDGAAVPALGVRDGDAAAATAPAARVFASARLYARSLDDVAPLAAWVRDQGIEVATRAKEIESVKALDRVLAFVFLVLASIGVGGYLFSLAASLWANIDRKRREIALLRLVGLGTGPVIGFPVAQAVLVALAGIALSMLLYLGVAAAFNTVFVDQLGRDEFVCRLSPRDGLIAAALTVLFAVAAAMVGGYRAAKIDPAEGLRAS